MIPADSLRCRGRSLNPDVALGVCSPDQLHNERDEPRSVETVTNTLDTRGDAR